MDKNAMKKMAAERSVDFVEDNMILGLGTGSTVVYMVEALAKRVQAEHLNLTCVCTSIRTEEQAKSLGIPVKALNDVDHIDLTIDGADEVDANFQGIKGGGAAHLFEKLVATTSTRNIWIVDQEKVVDTIGRFPLPVEVIPFGSQQVFNKMAKEGLNPEFRMTADGQHVLTDSKNYVIDLHLNQVQHPHLLASWLSEQVGVVEHGLFLDIVDQVVVGAPDGVKILTAK
ncbi:ribose-5-phosphate isomerase RpiA [Latilactobacillus curvatus]|uniref:Ribose-5-phosphate isomerase A n=1 Tax=Latilactobacillus curvatus TaxID=28038 RepID=A0A0B2XPT5_LATCU|nr:ribose-5-phosphate isomerase RpiA [Latilactobacillus curvatus]ANJ68811.1 ribose 5-phosphate isomerase A [Latilactobacillus curvatus]AOO76072.1 ribose 5-phosphate isomerase A [Latilactobacillus curvatus]ASN60691.1 ribose 5-phosphate isomerase A [Latilactobacillus curvatus]ASN62647.1 ribose 5-phosphate isomerase A [Latilactobacillus curvatus]AXN36492.1 ribose-5-phosphate isomerase RpiA [Latilactobacillus curvatus]